MVMSKWFLVLSAGVLLQACGASPESTAVEEGALRAGPGAPSALVCCREKFPVGPRRGQCVAEATRGEGPCASGHHPGLGGGPRCKDAGAGKDAALDAGKDAAVDAGNHCASVSRVWVASQPTPAQFHLSHTTEGSDPSGFAVDWHVVGASVGKIAIDPATDDATFSCTALGTQTVELTITGGDPTAGCTSSASLVVDCTTLCGNATVDPSETCDPPDGVTCDATCNRINRCPVLTSVLPTNPVIDNFDTTIVTASASDPDPADTLTYAWSASAGSFSGATTGAAPGYVCGAVGVQTINVTVSDGLCTAAGSTQITCLAVCGNGVLEPGEQCDPPDGVTCDTTCNPLNHCPAITSLVIAQPNLALGDTSAVTATVSEPDPGDTLTYTWGTGGNPIAGSTTSPTATLTCQYMGPDNVRLTVSDGRCSTTTIAMFQCIPVCGNGIVEPSEQCDPPKTGSCSATCQTVAAVCGDGVVEPGEGCDLGPTTPALCRNCGATNCLGCFVSQGGGAGLCNGLNLADTQACNALVTCTANGIGSCASPGGAPCYCTDTLWLPGHTPLFCATGPADGVCAAQFQALAHSNDPTVVMAQINDPATPVGKVAAAAYSFAHGPCGPVCSINN
jgi:hypothetical protein